MHEFVGLCNLVLVCDCSSQSGVYSNTYLILQSTDTKIKPSVYHALVVIFLEFFAWGLLTTPTITVSLMVFYWSSGPDWRTVTVNMSLIPLIRHDTVSLTQQALSQCDTIGIGEQAYLTSNELKKLQCSDWFWCCIKHLSIYNNGLRIHR